MTKNQATAKIITRLLKSTKEDVALELGISRPTLDKRLKFNTWKKSELTHIDKL